MKTPARSTTHLHLLGIVLLGAATSHAATWDGGGTDNNWSTADNWDTLPANGDPLTFAGTLRQTSTNDLLTSVGALTFSTAGWTITGNAVSLNGNVTHNTQNGLVNWGLETNLTATRTITVTVGKTFEMSGLITGVGGINGVAGSTGTGTIRLSGVANTFDGQVNANSSRLEVTKLANGGEASSVGDGTSEIIIGSAATGYQGTFSYIGTTDSSTNRNLRVLCWGTYGANVRNDSPNNSNLTFTATTDWYLGWRDNNATLRLQGTSTGTSTIAGKLSDSDYTAGKTNSLDVNTSGIWVLSGANTYTGATTVTAGTLLVNNTTGSGTGTGTVSVAANANLGGTGTINGPATISGNLNAGNGGSTRETLAFGGTLDLSAAQKTTFNLAGAATRGTDYDGIDVTGALTYGGTLELNFASIFADGTYSFDLFNLTSQSGNFSAVNLAGAYTGSLTNSGGVWSLSSGGNSWQFTQSTGDLAFTAVPEPTSALGGLLLAAGMLRRRRLSARSCR